MPARLSERRPERWLAAALVVLGLLAWEALARTGAVSALFFPPPALVLRCFGRLLAQGEMVRHVAATLERVLAGFLLGGLPGLALGLAMGWFPRLRAALDPLVAAAHPLPKVALLPLLMLVLGIGEASRIVVVAMAAFFPMLINTAAGVRQIRPVYFEVARNYGAGRAETLTSVVLPGSLPLALAGVRLALNLALLVAIAVELVAAPSGLGRLIWVAWQTLRTEELYAALLATAALGVGFSAGLARVAAWLAPWQAEATP